jgi:hypothetical protein
VIARRIITREELFPMQRVESATDPRRRCHQTIELDAQTYRCARGTIGGAHEGIHDALASHGDGGAVRW